MNTFRVCTRREYFQELVERIDKTKSGDRVAVATMAFHPEETEIAAIHKSLCEASQRGVTTYLQIDAFSFLVSKSIIPGPLLFLRKLPKWLPQPFKRRRDALRKLRECGGNFTVSNRPTRLFVLPFSGRSHIKFAVVNDETYVGGCNLTSVDDTDLMVYQKNKQTADWLYAFAIGVNGKRRVRDYMNDTDDSLKINTDTSLVIDSGVPKQSAIFDAALQLIDDAEEKIIMTCQYFPNDSTINRLNAAVSRGVDVELIYNHPSKHPFPMNLLHGSVKFVEKRRIDHSLFKHELSRDHHYIHAKLLASEKTCIVGSNNYIETGVKFGTAEIAYISTSADFREKAITALKNQI